MNVRPDYSYQEKLVEKVLAHVKAGQKKIVLAAAPGAGKTKMAFDLIEKLNKQTLVLTHAQNIIREQWVERARDRGLDCGVINQQSPKVITFNKGVTLALPQTLAKRKIIDEVFALITDEAHERYLAGQVQSIIERVNPGVQILLTGTPYNFVEKEDYALVSMSAKELLEHGVIQDISIKLIDTPYNISPHEYNNDFFLKKHKTFSQIETQKTIQGAIDFILKEKEKIGKTMVVCHNRRQAFDVHNYLRESGFNSVLSISSDYGVSKKLDNEEIFAFQSNPEIEFLIVVRRGILGFDYAHLENIVDMSGAVNPYVLFQLMCRLVRRSGEKKKLYLKVSSKEMALRSYLFMSYAVALSHPDYYSQGFNTRTTRIPVGEKFVSLINPSEFKIFSFKDIKPLNEACVTTFARALRRVNAGKVDIFKIKNLLNNYPSRNEFRKKERGTYNYLMRMKLGGLLDEAFGATEIRKWSEKSDAEIVRAAREIQKKEKHKTYLSFRLKNSALEKQLKKRGLQGAIPIKRRKRELWTMEKALKRAEDFRGMSLGEFRAEEYQAYYILKDAGKLPNFFKKNVNKPWGESDIQYAISQAKKFKRVRDFRTKHPGAYRHLWRRPEIWSDLMKNHFSKAQAS